MDSSPWSPNWSKTDYNADGCSAYNFILNSIYCAYNETGLFRRVFEEPIDALTNQKSGILENLFQQ